MSVPPTGPPRVGWFVKQRRIELNLSQSAAAELARVSRPTWSSVERGIATDPEDTTLGSVERALRWVPGCIQHILNGGAPIKLPDEQGLDRVEKARLVIEWAKTDPDLKPGIRAAIVEAAEGVLAAIEAESDNRASG